MNTDQIDAALAEMEREGNLEQVGVEDGQPIYQLTDKGRAYAERLLRRMGVDPNDGEAVHRILGLMAFDG
jgi:DNA-binding PadR family transcriptional regulator